MKLFPKLNLSRLKEGLTKTRTNIITKITEAVTRKGTIGTDFLEELEEILISSDLGSTLAERVIERTKSALFKEKDREIETVKRVIKNELVHILSETGSKEQTYFEGDFQKPYVILISGINGSGKTTTIGKLAYKLKTDGFKVLIASGDTFRAAANDQLKVWTTNANVDLMETLSGDASAVVYDAITKAIKEKYDIVLVDTAGRLQNNKNLMLELAKIQKVTSNLIPNAPHESLIVLDANSGQNAIVQTNEFQKYIPITGIILTKLDGTAKGGVIFQICMEKEIPIRFIGIGEKIDDLQYFDSEAFVDAIFDEQ
jgi:fused signal recognition particle receptor